MLNMRTLWWIYGCNGFSSPSLTEPVRTLSKWSDHSKLGNGSIPLGVVRFFNGASLEIVLRFSRGERAKVLWSKVCWLQLLSHIANRDMMPSNQHEEKTLETKGPTLIDGVMNINMCRVGRDKHFRISKADTPSSRIYGRPKNTAAQLVGGDPHKGLHISYPAYQVVVLRFITVAKSQI